MTSSTSHSNPLKADAQLTHRVETFTGESLQPLALDWPDSANWLWRSEGVAPRFYKLARTRPATDGFWRGMQALFGQDRWQLPHALTDLAAGLPPQLPMAPLPMTYWGRLDDAPLWSLPWREAPTPVNNSDFATRLGEQVGRLHAEAVPGWGCPATRVEALATWPQRARRFAHEQAPQMARSIHWPMPSRAVWCLPDLRADQFLIGATDWLWSDWEALVWAPVEFDLCLIELLFDTRPEQQAFMTAYRRFATPVSLALFRPGMRLLARLFHLHGECSDTWVEQHPMWLKD